jgi:organic hydroperoxide reductase OsmC/OhrA
MGYQKRDRQYNGQTCVITWLETFEDTKELTRNRKKQTGNITLVKQNGQTMIYITLHRAIKIEQQNKTEVNLLNFVFIQ